MSIKPPVVWCVGGARSPAHTGLQADLRTGQHLDCHVHTIVTAMSVQSADGVSLIEPVSLIMFDEQWQTLLKDVPPDAIKIGLLPSSEIVKACSTWLKQMKAELPNLRVVFDPVIGVSNDVQVNSAAGLLAPLLPSIDVITPNANAFAALTHFSAEQSITDLHTQLAAYFYASSCRWLIEGENVEAKKATDWLVDQTTVVGFASNTINTHESGGESAIFSMVLVCFMAHGYDVLDSVTMAKAYCSGEESSWPWQLKNLPKIVMVDKALTSCVLPFAAMDFEKMGLYPVVDTIAWLELVLKQGVNIAQLRIKDPDDVALESKIQQAIALGTKYQAQVFINDYWQQAIAFGAYGVHLGQEDLDVANLAKIQAAGLRLGISTHGYYEIARAQSIQPSYIALGHIFPTQTKDMPSQPQGLVRLAHYVRLLKGHYPTVAIGGINAQRLPAVAQTGVESVALVTAITQADEPEAATRSLIMSFEHHSNRPQRNKGGKQ